MSFALNSRRVIFPFLVSKDIKPVAFLLSPRDLLVTLCLIVLLAQVSDNLKSVLSFKEIQRLSSVKFYAKHLSSGISSLSVSSAFAISKTLGPDLETLSVLTSQERIQFLRFLHLNLFSDRLKSVSLNKSLVFVDPIDLMIYRKGLALQCRSIFSATPIFLPHSIVAGLPVKNVDLNLILDSCRELWLSWGLEQSEFDFSLRKDALKFYLTNFNSIPFLEPVNIYQSCKILLFSEFSSALKFDNKISFEKDFVFFKTSSNLTALEEEFGFFFRPFPRFSKDFFLTSLHLKDDIIRLASDQRKLYELQLKRISFS